MMRSERCGREQLTWPHTGAILAGGRSSRMGAPKFAMTLPDGRSMLDAIADVLCGICSKIVVVGHANPGQARGYVNIADMRPSAGPLGGMKALLASGIDSQYLICPCDMPLVTAQLLSQLVRGSQALATAFAIEGEPDPIPMPLRLSSAALSAVRKLLDSDHRAVHALLREISVDSVCVGADAAAALRSVNTPAEFREACRIIQQQAVRSSRPCS